MKETFNDIFNKRQAKKDICFNCNITKEQMCVNNRKGGRTILPLSAEPRQVVEVDTPIERCEVIVYKKEGV